MFKKYKKKTLIYNHVAIIRGDSTKKELSIVFTGDEFGDGADFIAHTLKNKNIKASFFLTGRFYRNEDFRKSIGFLKAEKNYLGSHSDQHLLYCDWTKRDSLLVSRKEFMNDLQKGYSELQKFGIQKTHAKYFLPPYEWFNDSISSWTNEMGLQLINFTPGTRSNADYTTPDMKNYKRTSEIFDSIINYEQKNSSGLNGFILLIHIGTDPKRTDKLYKRLPELINYLKRKHYKILPVDELLKLD